MTADASRSERFINRELSWLAFNERVLEEAADPTTPLLERLKFAAIVASNLDEFFMVRVAGLRHAVGDGDVDPDLAGLTPAQQLAAISRARARDGRRALSADVRDEIMPALAAAGVRIVPWTRARARSSRSRSATFFRERRSCRS